MRKLFLGFLALLVVGGSVMYWQDPWLWRRFANNFALVAGGDTEPQLLRPNELIDGGGGHRFETVGADDRTINPEAIQAAIEFAQRMDSFALLIVRNGKIEGEWYVDGADASTLMQSQSMHKSIQALLVGTAIDNGLIDSADEPVGEFIEAWAGDPRGDITLYELMTMSSGLQVYGFTLNPFGDAFKRLFSGYSLAPTLRTPRANWAPGDKWEYNDINSELLGNVIAASSGLRYAAYLEKYLWEPMGGGEARVYLDREDGDAFTACCLMATARDWARVGLVLLNRGELNGRRVVSAEWVDRMVEQSPTSKWYGLQTWLAYEDEMSPWGKSRRGNGSYWRAERFAADDAIFFSGYGGQKVYVVPSQELVIVRLGPALGPNPLKDGWDNAFLVNTVIRGLRE